MKKHFFRIAVVGGALTTFLATAAPLQFT